MKIIETDVGKTEDTIQKLADDGARLITMNCEDHGDHFELMYFFDFLGEADVQTIKTVVKKDEKASSISKIYPYASLIEAEMSEMFGLQFKTEVANPPHFMLADDSLTTPLSKSVLVETQPVMRKIPKCVQECPLHLDIPEYIRYVSRDDQLAALKVIKSKLAIPMIVGRICPAFCEDACRRCNKGGAAANRLLKRHASDIGYKYYKEEPPKIETGKNIAIVGGGPAGISAAYFLRKQGHSVTIFDERPRLGGMMRLIPKFRLPRKVIDFEINSCCSIGINSKTNTAVNNLDDIFNKGFDAIFVGTGAKKSSKLGIPGEENPRVLGALEFLRAVHDDSQKVDVGDKVITVGGGDVAMDVARTALRLGASEVSVYYRRNEEEMPANPFEREEAKLEGAKFVFLASPTRILGSPKGVKAEFIRMELEQPDASGRRRVSPKAGTEFQVEVDTVISAIGSAPEVPAGYNLNLSKAGFIVADEQTLQTSRKGVFSAGDIATGPKSVAHACAGGRSAAHYIDKYLGGKGLPNFDEWRTDLMIPKPIKTEELEHAERNKPEYLTVEERLKGFDEVEYGFDKKYALKEAKRCFNCDWNE